MTRLFETDDRPEGLMGDLALCDRALRGADRQSASAVRRLPNRRALAVLDEMYAYFDMEPRAEIIDTSYDRAA